MLDVSNRDKGDVFLRRCKDNERTRKWIGYPPHQQPLQMGRKPDELLQAFEWELVSRAEFERLASLDPSTLTDVQRAHRFYYLIMAGWGGEANYPRFQISISDGGHGNRLIGALKHLEARIRPVHNRLRTAIIENLPWEACVDKYDRKGTFMYIDPPYPANGVNYRHNMRDWSDHRRLASRLSQAKCQWMMSSYDSSEVRDLFANYVITPVQAYSGMKAKKSGSERVLNQEVLITNYAPVGAFFPMLPDDSSLEPE